MKIKVMLFYLFSMLFPFMLPAKEVYFKHISSKQGLSQLSAISIWQDEAGCMWFGNSALNRYDGNGVEVFRISNYTTWGEDNNIRSICGDSANMMYILANKEIITYNLHTEEFLQLNISANAICYTNNTLYYARENQLFAYNSTEEKEILCCVLPESASTIQTVIAKGTDELLVGTATGVYVVNARKQTADCLYGHASVSCLFVDSQATIWIGTQNDGVHVLFANGSSRQIRKDGRMGYTLSNNSIRCFEEETDGSVWVGTYQGVNVIDSHTFACSYLVHNDLQSYSLRHNSVYAIYKDKQGTMWVGTYYGGVNYSNPTTELYTFYSTENDKQHSLNGFIIGKMTEDASGKLYIGSEGGGLNIFTPTTGKIETVLANLPLLPHNTIKSLWYDTELDQLFIGTFKDGLLLYLPKTNQFTRIGGDVLTRVGQQIIQGLIPYDRFLILHTQDGIYKLDRTSYEITLLFKKPDTWRQCSNMIRTLYLDTHGKLWVSSVQNGLFTVDMTTEEIHSYPADISGSIGKSPVIRICGNEQGELYLSTLGNGIYRYNRSNDTFAGYTEESHTLLSDVCYNLAFTPQGNLLITSDKGITLFNIEQNTSRHILLDDNFPLKAFIPDCGLYVSPITGKIYIGGMYGLLACSEKDISVKNDHYRLYFSSLSVNNKSVSPHTHPDILKAGIGYTDKITLTHDQNNISITFASSDYASMKHANYEYKMEGYDSYWVKTSIKRITYSALPPGNYLFTVREINNAAKETVIRIVVRPPFYASGIAWILYFIVATGIFYWLVRIHKSKVLLEASLVMEHREKERIEELNQVKLRFFTNISHEFRTPLTLIGSQLDSLLRADGTAAAMRTKLSRIKKHTLRMQELITELLDFRKQEEGKFTIKATKQDINGFLAEIYAAFTEYATSRKIAYRFNHTAESTLIWFDALQLQKVVYNLLSNAFKFTPNQGEVNLSLEVKADAVWIRVKNVGPEIDKEQLALLFNRFYQVDNFSITTQLPGSGIGLALCKGIVDAHKGEITVCSENNQTSFQVILQRGDSHLKPDEKSDRALDLPPLTVLATAENTDTVLDSDQDESIPSLNRLSLLIVEDNDELRHLIRDAFCSLYDILEAHDGEEGLVIAREKMPNLILSDIMMPRLSGTDMCIRLKNHIETSHIPIILLTAQSSVEQNIAGLRHGADDYITKPFNMELLVLKCNNMVKTQLELQHKFCNQSTPEVSTLVTNTLDQELLSKSIALIEAHLDDAAFDISVWSREIGIGRTRLFNKIKAITGLTCNDFILNIKLKKAAALLSGQKELTISEIAYQLGFSTPGYFGKCFKDQFGVTPLQYRKK